MSSKHGEEVVTGSIIAETSTVQGSACPIVQAQGRLSQVMESEKKYSTLMRKFQFKPEFAPEQLVPVLECGIETFLEEQF